MNARDLVHQLGGVAQVARRCCVSMAAVCGWYAAGIPARHYAALWALARERKVAWTPPGFDAVALAPAPLAQDQAA